MEETSTEPAMEMALAMMEDRPEQAEDLLEYLAQYKPSHDILRILGQCKQRLGKHKDAIDVFERLEGEKPLDLEAINGMALSYGALGMHHKAVDLFRVAVQTYPKDLLLANNLAIQLWETGEHEKSICLLLSLLEREDNALLWSNLGTCYGKIEQWEKAKEAFTRCVELDPNNAAAHVHLGNSYLLEGNWKQGLAELEWRKHTLPEWDGYRRECSNIPEWDGQADLSGKSILLYGEQGYGDMIMFSRFATNFKQMNAQVIVNCPQPLGRIMSKIEGVDKVATRNMITGVGEKLPQFDYHLSLFSTLHKLDLDSVPDKPYIHIQHGARADYLRRTYPESLRIGIVWTGNSGNTWNDLRSIPVSSFLPLSNIEGVKLINLQLGGSPEWLDGMEKIQMDSHVMQDVSDFLDTADVISGLDLIIGCDTSVTHLAAAMGVPVWLCIVKNAEWRWTTHGERTYWYESMRLFRQTTQGSWGEVFDRVHLELLQLLKNNSIQISKGV